MLWVVVAGEGEGGRADAPLEVRANGSASSLMRSERRFSLASGSGVRAERRGEGGGRIPGSEANTDLLTSIGLVGVEWLSTLVSCVSLEFCERGGVLGRVLDEDEAEGRCSGFGLAGVRGSGDSADPFWRDNRSGVDCVERSAP